MKVKIGDIVKINEYKKDKNSACIRGVAYEEKYGNVLIISKEKITNEETKESYTIYQGRGDHKYKRRKIWFYEESVDFIFIGSESEKKYIEENI